MFECISRWQKINSIDDVTESASFIETYEYIVIYQVLDQLMAVYIEPSFKCFAKSLALPLESYIVVNLARSFGSIWPKLHVQNDVARLCINIAIWNFVTFPKSCKQRFSSLGPSLSSVREGLHKKSYKLVPPGHIDPRFQMLIKWPFVNRFW